MEEVLYKAQGCKPCENLALYIDKAGISTNTKELSFEELRKGEYPFKTVPSLVLVDGSVISGFPQIRLYLSKKDKK